MFSKLVLPSLALVGSVLAQCDGPSITIKTSDDATAIASCTLYNGSVIIDPSASGNIALNGVRQISGDLTCNNATQLTQISSDQLNTIGGTFSLTGLTILTTLQFNSLSRVNRINWVGLPNLQGLNFGQGVSEANGVYISNTQLNTLSGIELTQVARMDINNNNYLDTINVNSLTNVTDFLSFSANGPNLMISFPNLASAANMTFRNVSNIQTPSLNSVAGSMGFYSNTMQSYSAPNLTTIGNTLAVVDSSQLSNLSFPSLTGIGGGMQLINNTKLESLNGFQKLQTIGGAIDFYGVFTSVAFPSLKQVSGGATVQISTNNQTICDLFNAAKKNSVIRGSESCSVGQGNALTNGSSTSSGSGSSSSKNAADATLFDPSAPLTGIAAFIAALLFL